MKCAIKTYGDKSNISIDNLMDGDTQILKYTELKNSENEQSILKLIFRRM